ncbi:DUF1700 domain-containing protein [Anaerosporobacter faecicola]|uniref:DUF1700 domain-containing protein n=1 Tax=Anaerosporobacter faecicola TaxID=2718714 RepID=UPI00143B4AD4|nr:DUF1700 domain-containing protein [Anaerosporobacter faecicola]
MSRQEFINELENLLANIPEKDRQEAIQYYQDYFEDAGVENEEQIIHELGTPERVAAIIQEDLRNEGMKDRGEFTEKGYHNPAFDQNKQDVVMKVDPTMNQQGNQQQYYQQNGQQYGQTGQQYNQQYGQTNGQQNNQNQEPQYVYEYSSIPKVLLIIGAVLFIPVGIPLLATGFGLFVAAMAVIFSMVVTFGALAFGLTFGGVAMVVAGISQLFSVPMYALLVCGGGLILVSIGLLSALVSKIFAKMIPMFFKGVINLLRLPFRRRVMA